MKGKGWRFSWGLEARRSELLGSGWLVREDGSKMERVPGSWAGVTDRAIAEKKKPTLAYRGCDFWKRAQGSVKPKNLDRACGDGQGSCIPLVGRSPQLKYALQDSILA